MVFKGRFFSSSKKSSTTDSSTSSPDGSNSPKTPTLDSPNRSEKKKVKSDSSPASSFRPSLIRDAVRQHLNRDSKDKSPPAAAAKDKDKDNKGKDSKSSAAAEGSLSPIMASSLGLNRIKTRSGPLPQETAHRMSTLGSTNLGRGGERADRACSTSSALGKSSGKKKDARGLEKVQETYASSWGDRDGGSAGRGKDWSGDSRFRSPIGNGDSSSAAAAAAAATPGQFGALLRIDWL